MNLIIQLLTEKTISIKDIKPTDTIATLKLMIFESEGLALDEQRLIFNGNQLKDELSLVDYEIEESSRIHLVLRRRGMTKIFTNWDVVSDPLMAYLMMTDEARSMAPIPIDELLKARNSEQAEDFVTYNYVKDPELLNDKQRELLCGFLDFMWTQNSQEKDESKRTDLRLSMTVEQISAVLGVLDWSIEEDYKSRNTVSKLSECFTKVPDSRPVKDILGKYNYRIVLRITRGPTSACVAFHCDGEFASSTSEIPLNDQSEYKGGNTCFYVNGMLHIVPRVSGSLCQHPPKVLRGVTRLTDGTSKCLFIVDNANVNGDPNVLEVTSDHIVNFLATAK
mmetsp:Transcript_8001/g.17090  ORF Transcript_8001/g.17090 Transcript_8001/m.17090 type:complete len:336 (+) Transcript_8001:334-1341(+)|eukprot:CAMPEP_0171356230 /NCGR_PEP_ID=MMETSP0878-20121228/45624_1 /TAXON_ID=67004 /ORGANISM="Thalassiosira weissflogii, Strain CCMP1336" /LENGTH=335 /DNA_ID=CAMNT_0011862247 /DNA_START=292 /DNA_END=1299 /DNA_ORIENTATION=+